MTIKFETFVFFFCCRFFRTGLWHEAVIVLFNLQLKLDISDARLDSVLESMNYWSFNRYGLLKPQEVLTVMNEATVEGE